MLIDPITQAITKEEGPGKAIDRVSKMGKYELELGTHRPINPRGRTGVQRTVI